MVLVLLMSLAVAVLAGTALADEAEPGWNDCASAPDRATAVISVPSCLLCLRCHCDTRMLTGKKERCDLRIIRHPQLRNCNTTDRHDPCRAARNAVDRPWALEYEYAVPSHKQMPTGKDWNAKDEVYYIWGDTDFDTYGVHPRAMFPMSKFLLRSILHT